jgi:multidrug efflux system membrane fusion protein
VKRLGLLIAFVVLAGLGYMFFFPHSNMPPAGKGPTTVATASPGKGSGKGRSSAIPSIVAATAKTEDVPISKTVVGNIEPIDTVVIRPQADGVVMVTDVKDGQMVKTGDVLFQLDDRTIRATIDKDKAALAKDQANLDSANQDLIAAQALSNRKIDTQQQAYQALAAVNALKASIAMDTAQIEADEVQLSYMTIKAPIDGRVGVVNTSVGNLVRMADTGSGLLTITRMAPLRVSFTVAESDLPTLRDAMKDHPLNVLIKVPGSKNVVASGPLNFVDSSVDPASGTIVLKADMANENGALWPGQYVTATVEIGTPAAGRLADTMATSVATPLIKQFATIAGIDSISTTNSQGSTSIAIQFVLNRNIDAAAADVQAAIARAQKQLPLEMTTPPSYRKVNPADAPIILLALKSDVVPLRSSTPSPSRSSRRRSRPSTASRRC